MKMKHFVYPKLFCSLLLVVIFLNMMPQNAYARSTYIVEIDGRPISMSMSPYSDGEEIMVPFRALTEGLGGIWLDVPTGKAHKVAILNDLAFYIITTWNVQITMPLTDDITYDAFSGAKTVDDYIPIIMELIYDGTISVKYFDYQIIEVDGDFYFPLREFASGLALNYSVNGNTIKFDSEFKNYQPSNSNVTFQLNVPNSKTYDGKPITWSQDALKVFCDGKQVTDYLPLTLEYSYLNQNNEIQFISSPPQNAGSYTLAVQTNSKDPQYSGTGYFSFMIYPAELILTAQDAEILVGDPLPSFLYDISGIAPSETRWDAIVEEPILTVQGAVEVGSYPIEITGGTAGKNYMIKDRRAGTLTISSEARLSTFQIQCIDQMTGRTLKIDEQQAIEGSTIIITAPDLVGYQVSGAKMQEIFASEGKMVTFNYTKIVEVPDQTDDVTTVPASATIYPPYVMGYSNEMFYPQAPIKRNECVTMLYRLLQQIEPDSTIVSQAKEFKDVSVETWYHSAVSVLAAKGIVNGYSDGTFQPENAITRAEFLAVALRFSKIPLETAGGYFSDVPASHWAANYIQTAVKNGFVSGYADGSFRPDVQITRAEAVTMLNRITGRNQCVIADNISSFVDVPIGFWAYQDIMLAANQVVLN